jgi:hypothetical protein
MRYRHAGMFTLRSIDGIMVEQLGGYRILPWNNPDTSEAFDRDISARRWPIEWFDENLRHTPDTSTVHQQRVNTSRCRLTLHTASISRLHLLATCAIRTLPVRKCA